MPERRTLRVAIVGLRHTHVGRLGLQSPSPGCVHNFKQLRAVRVVAYCGAVAPALLAGADFALACICLPASEVPQVGIRLAAAGKHFFMEKQFARTSVELAGLVQAVRRNGVTVLAGYPWRFHPVAQDLARLRDEGV